jgi:hypothetical protein
MKTSEIDPATFRFVAQCLNHCDTARPGKFKYQLKIVIQPSMTFVLYLALLQCVRTRQNNFPYHNIKNCFWNAVSYPDAFSCPPSIVKVLLLNVFVERVRGGHQMELDFRLIMTSYWSDEYKRPTTSSPSTN